MTIELVFITMRLSLIYIYSSSCERSDNDAKCESNGTKQEKVT